MIRDCDWSIQIWSVTQSSDRTRLEVVSWATHDQNMKMLLVWFMVFNATFNNISVISWWSVLLVEETEVPGENHWHDANVWQTLSHNVVSSTPHHERGLNSQLFTDYTGSCKSNHHMIMTTTALKVSLVKCFFSSTHAELSGEFLTNVFI